MKQAPTVVICPACESPCEVDIDQLDEGDALVCDQCDEAFTVVSLDPLVVALDEDDADDLDEDDDDLDDDDESDDDLDDDGDDEEEDDLDDEDE